MFALLGFFFLFAHFRPPFVVLKNKRNYFDQYFNLDIHEFVRDPAKQNFTMLSLLEVGDEPTTKPTKNTY